MIAAAARKAAQNILFDSLRLHAVRNGIAHVVVAVDCTPCPLSAALAEGYHTVLHSSPSIVVHRLPFRPSQFLSDVRGLQEQLWATRSCSGELQELVACILIQRGAFQNELKEYRLRLRLFEMGLRVAEHAHLGSMNASPKEMFHYLASCSASCTEAKQEGSRIAMALDSLAKPSSPLNVVCTSPVHRLQTTEVDGDELRLTFEGYLEPCLLNTGVYSGAFDSERNCIKSQHEKRRLQLNEKESRKLLETNSSSIGGTFPTGEVITESEDLGRCNGRASIFSFPNTSKKIVVMDEPFEISIKDGCIDAIAPNAPLEFVELIDMVREVEGEAMIRELGIGLNPYVGRQGVVSDVTSFERQRGVHLSVGKRHPLFRKTNIAGPTPGRPERHAEMRRGPLKRKDGTFHIDIFLDAIRMDIIQRNEAGGQAPSEKVLFSHNFPKFAEQSLPLEY